MCEIASPRQGLREVLEGHRSARRQWRHVDRLAAASHDKAKGWSPIGDEGTIGTLQLAHGASPSQEGQQAFGSDGDLVGLECEVPERGVDLQGGGEELAALGADVVG